jgi:hypothetical protein
MSKPLKLALTLTCILAAGISFLYLIMRNRDDIGEYYAHSSVNIEIDQRYAQNIAIAIETSPDPCAYWMSPTAAADPQITNVIMHVSIPLKRPYWNPAIRLPEEQAAEALAAIDHVAYFVGNKIFYFSHEDVLGFRKNDREGYVLYYLPGIFYERSLVFKNWSNYYGDINLGIKALTAFFVYPAQFAPVWAFLILLGILWWKQIGDAFSTMKKSKQTVEIVLLIIIILAGFVLRWNGHVRHSGWTDEIYSAVRTGNPNLPFISTFGDRGNPPFYFILLRYWFKIFGWSEEAGTMLSVLLGTGAIVTLYCFIKPFFGGKTALYAALFMAVSGFAIDYSQEMRAYILKMFLVPLVAIALFSFMKKPSLKNLILYLLPSIAIVNAHYYGIVLIMANFVFYLAWMLYSHSWKWKRALIFFGGNIVVALSFMPFFLYMIFYMKYDFSRDYSLEIGHAFAFLVSIVIIAAFFLLRKKLAKINAALHIIKNEQGLFLTYLVCAPLFIFMLVYIISFYKPMLTFRYLWPICAPFCFALAAAVISCIGTQKNWRFAAPLLVYMFVAGLPGLRGNIPSGGIEGYREARAYIAADAAAHPERRAAMLDSAPQNALYYGFPVLDQYAPGRPVDVLYVYNDIFTMHEINMYDALRKYNLENTALLKVKFDYEYPRADGGVVFKKYFRKED